jgi:transcriptional antiterminator Rof (Rho-off)
MDESKYIPVACGLYDSIEHAIVRKSTILIQFQTIDGIVSEMNDQPIDLISKNQAEFVILKSGIEIRLDKISTIDGKTFNSCSTK